MTARDTILQVLTVICLGLLIQGVILQFEEQGQRGRGGGIFQPYRVLRKLFRKQIVVAVTATTALTFSNALRTFYSCIYRPTAATTREATGREHFVAPLKFNRDVASMFGPSLFVPIVCLVRFAADRVRILQSGRLNFYLGLIGLLLVIIAGLALL